jgi:uncharacterized membrane protein YkgB
MEIRNYNSTEKIGAFIIRYGLVVILLWIGLLKFTSYEAMGIKPLVANGILAWGYSILSIQTLSNLLGVVEIIVAILIALGPVLPKISVFGSYGAIIMGVITLTFILTTPAKAIWQDGMGFPFLSPMPGQFLIKDLLLVGAGFFTAGESIRASKRIHTGEVES